MIKIVKLNHRFGEVVGSKLAPEQSYIIVGITINEDYHVTYSCTNAVGEMKFFKDIELIENPLGRNQIGFKFKN